MLKMEEDLKAIGLFRDKKANVGKEGGGPKLGGIGSGGKGGG